MEHIDLLKLDAESCEMPVIEGIRPEHLARIRQTVIEVHGGPAEVERIVGFLQGYGFTTREDEKK